MFKRKDYVILGVYAVLTSVLLILAAGCRSQKRQEVKTSEAYHVAMADSAAASVAVATFATAGTSAEVVVAMSEFTDTFQVIERDERGLPNIVARHRRENTVNSSRKSSADTASAVVAVGSNSTSAKVTGDNAVNKTEEKTQGSLTLCDLFIGVALFGLCIMFLIIPLTEKIWPRKHL